MCQSSWGPVQCSEAACPLHVAPQPVLEAYVVPTTYQDTCSKGILARRKARSVHPTGAARLLCDVHLKWTRECNQCWSGLIWSNPSGMTLAVDAICPRSLWTVSAEPQSCLWRNSGNSALIGRARPWGAPSYSLSLTPHREKRLSAQGRACSFPSWPEAPTGWGAGARGPCDRTTVLRTGPEWVNRRVEDPDAHFP